MASVYEDAVLDFDLTFLRQSSNNTVNPSKVEKQKKAVALVKKKIIATNSLIGKYYGKRQELEETEKSLLVSKEECKQICIDYRNALETCAKLETDVNLIQNANKELEEKFFHTDTQLEAVKSHANQLQGLVNEQKTKIESLEIENKLEKATFKDNEKKAQTLQKENEILRTNIRIFRDIILKKKILSPKYKELLRKYDKPCALSDTDDDPPEEHGHSDVEDDIFEDVPSPDSAMHSPQHFSEVQKPAIVEEVGSPEFDRNEAASIDTGRGSSLAFSDNEKCFHRPDYFINNSPGSKDILNHVKAKLVDIATSPVRTTVETATSPMHLPDNSLLCQVTLEEEDCLSNYSPETLQKPNIEENNSVRAVEVDLTKSLSRSPFKTINKSIFSPEKAAYKINEKNITQEKQCMELNNSSNDVGENSNDVEIATILNTMRFHQNLLTPIPSSPAKSRDREILRPASSICKKIQYNGNYMCQDAVSVREENRKLQDSIADLAKEMINIKSLLKSHLCSFQFLEVDSNKEDTIPKIADATSDSIKCVPISKQINSTSDIQSTGSVSDHNNIDRVLDSNKGVNIFNSVRHQTKEVTIDEKLVKNSNKSLPMSNSDLFGDDEDDNMHSSDEEVEVIAPIIDENEDTMTIEPLIHEDIISFRPVNVETEDTILCSPPLEEPAINTSSELQLLSSETLPTTTVSDIPLDDEMAVEGNSQIILQRIQFEESMPLPDHSNVDCERPIDWNSRSKDSDIKATKDSIKESADEISTDDNHSKVGKHRKLSNLQRLKKQLGPKYKIRTETPAPTARKLRMRPKQLPSPKKKVTSSDTSASLNDKDVYEKAVKVMAELKSKKQHTDTSDITNSILNKQSTLRESPTGARLNNEVCSPKSTITTRSRRKCIEDSNDSSRINIETNNNKEIVPSSPCKKIEKVPTISPRITRKRHRQSSSDHSEVQCKRLLRSSSISCRNESDLEQKTTPTGQVNTVRNDPKCDVLEPCTTPIPGDHTTPVSYNDIDMFSAGDKCFETEDSLTSKHNSSPDTSLKDNLLCKMLEKYGLQRVKNVLNKVPDTTIKSIQDKIESEIKRIIALPCNETKTEMNGFVTYIQTLNYKHFIRGLMQYLTQSERKTELFSKVNTPPAPSMTKSEQVLLYVIIQLRNYWPSVDFADLLLCNIEYTLFKLNQTPEFDVIESLSHFYAVICTYFKARSRLRLFILDAMYCIQFKSVPLIKQCLDVWLHVIPLAHMGIAKTPLVTCLVYLLHFYKCEDRFNRVQELRNMLKRKYFYQITEWNETKMLDMMRQAIMDVKEVPLDRKMLRLALIILAKRQGTRWCQNQVIKNVIMPILERDNVPERVKVFCVSLIGPLMKPYPDDMKIHCEIAMNQLVDLLEQLPSKAMSEAILTSLVYMSRHNQGRVIELLLSRKMTAMSKELEDILRDFVREKPLRAWKAIVKKTLC